MELMLEQHITKDRVVFQRFADMRYMGQEHTVKVALPAGRITAEKIPEINERFNGLYEHAYTFRLESSIELVNYHLTAFGTVEKPELNKIVGDGLSLSGAKKGSRNVNFDELGFHESPIYERDRFPVNEYVQGPMVIEEPASTTVVFPDQQMMRDEYGFLHIENID